VCRSVGTNCGKTAEQISMMIRKPSRMGPRMYWMDGKAAIFEVDTGQPVIYNQWESVALVCENA